MKAVKKLKNKEEIIAKLDKIMHKKNYETRTIIMDNVNNLIEIRYYYGFNSETLGIYEYLIEQDTFKILAKNKYFLKSF